MIEVENIIEKLLHVKPEPASSPGMNRVPVLVKKDYEMRQLCIQGENALFVRPLRQMPLPRLKSEWQNLETLSGLPCVFCLDDASRYGCSRMIELGIPFIMGEDNLYLPFLGVVLRKKRITRLPQITRFTPAAQSMLLRALYERWTTASCKEISERMNVSRMTASRSLIELQALNLPLVQTRGREKFFVFPESRRKLFELCAPYLDNPVSASYMLEEIPRGAECLGGRSAVSRYSPLADNAYLTYALTREEFKELEIAKYPTCLEAEDAACVIHVLRYKVNRDRILDPVSAVLSVLGEEKPSPREEAAMKKMLLDILKDEKIRDIL